LTDPPYFKIFTWMERTAAKASQEYNCTICGKVAFYSDIMNISDLLPSFGVVCPDCRVKYNESFELKLSQIKDY
jgi:DNA-directed RNA polymerase subunit RPC12/RpoP